MNSQVQGAAAGLVCVCGGGGGKWKCTGNRRMLSLRKERGRTPKTTCVRQNTGEGAEQEPGPRPQFSPA